MGLYTIMDQVTKALIDSLRNELKHAEERNVELVHKLAVMRERERLQKVAVLGAIESVMTSDAPLMRTHETSSTSGSGRHVS
jgi:hypothetical protein